MTETTDTEFEFVVMERVRLQGGKTGFAVALASTFDPEAGCPDEAQSFFLFKKAPTVGAIYRGKGKVEDGRIRVLVQDRSFQRKLSGPAVLLWEARTEAVERTERKARAEKKAKADKIIAAEVERIAAIIRKSAGRQDRRAMIAAVEAALFDAVFK